jgi:uncharacterized protein
MASGGPGGSEVERLPPMARYVLGLLRRPSGAPSLPSADLERIQESHLAHLRHLLEAGELITCGPLEEETDLRGILIFRTDSLAHARELMGADPAVVSGRLVLDLYTWYAPAGLGLRGAAPPTPDLTFETD